MLYIIGKYNNQRVKLRVLRGRTTR